MNKPVKWIVDVDGEQGTHVDATAYRLDGPQNILVFMNGGNTVAVFSVWRSFRRVENDNE